MAPGPLLEGRETGFTNSMTVVRLVLLQQPVADQQRDTTLADFNRRGHDHAPGAALAEASCTGSGCWFTDHVTHCYYAINEGFGPTVKAINRSLNPTFAANNLVRTKSPVDTGGQFAWNGNRIPF